ncbi:unnamed protein product [Sphenostylis stenocarpa]|uniref:Uncharacterized protein n=1 Tax=Sphenostylis stenocarpa TaxID=92480 RepID=A0AA86VJS1_9FABA|nr:unnamed protein product [Sphenostylis stenocarpa]
MVLCSITLRTINTASDMSLWVTHSSLMIEERLHQWGTIRMDPDSHVRSHPQFISCTFRFGSCYYLLLPQHKQEATQRKLETEKDSQNQKLIIGNGGAGCAMTAAPNAEDGGALKVKEEPGDTHCHTHETPLISYPFFQSNPL